MTSVLRWKGKQVWFGQNGDHGTQFQTSIIYLEVWLISYPFHQYDRLSYTHIVVLSFVNLVHIIIRSNNNNKSNEKIKTKVRKKNPNYQSITMLCALKKKRMLVDTYWLFFLLVWLKTFPPLFCMPRSTHSLYYALSAIPPPTCRGSAATTPYPNLNRYFN